MTPEGQNGQGSISGEPPGGGAGRDRRTGSPFDPVAGMRAVADIQAEGLRAAGELLERILGSEPDAPAPRPQAPVGELGALADAWLDLARRTIDGLARVGGRTGPVTVAVDAAGVGPQIRLNGSVAEVWLHNGTVRAVGPLALHCGPLTDADGATLDGADVCFEPRDVELLPARSSRGIVVSLATARPPRPGIYRGTIQAHGAPHLWLPLEVVIERC